MSFTAAQKFGWDAPHRIQTTTDYYAGALAMPLPGEPLYPTVLPFISTSGLSIVGGGMTPAVAEYRDEPTQLDLYFTAGNDVTVPLIFQDPDVPLDMSDSANWDWYAQVRSGRGPSYPLISEFICEAEYAAAAPPDVPLGITTVTMFLPRQDNIWSGDFFWDLKSVDPAALGPDEGDPDPTPGKAHTWLWGEVHVGPQVTVPPDEPAEVVVATPTFNSFLAVTVGHGVTVGPNGVVP